MGAVNASKGDIMAVRSSPKAAIPSAPHDRPFEVMDYVLYALSVIGWSAAWFAIKLQVGTVSNEVNLVWRFGIATVLMFGWVALSGSRWRFPPADHLRFAALGVLLFSTNFLLFYYGALYLVSGLLSVVFSLVSVVNMALIALIMRERPSVRVLLSGLVGFIGIGLMFLPEIVGDGFSWGILVGLALCIGGTVSFCLGNLVSTACQSRGLPIVSTNAWGMLYGTLWCTFLALVLGRSFILEPTIAYIGSLAFLAVIATVLAFAAYLTLLGRIGGARAGYATVVFPTFALLISTGFEDYHWTVPAVAGLVFVAIGNLLVILGKR
jgi:drug/metabolite transporter (DMT)-like permease